MTVMVTGASGFVGKTLIDSLAHTGVTGSGVSRTKIPRLPAGWNWRERHGVLRGVEAAPEPPPDWVIHLEVKHHVTDPMPTDEEEFERVNRGGTKEWLDWCSLRGVTKFAYFSSIKAIGGSSQVLDEGTNLPPGTPYGKSKLGGEMHVRAWAGEDRRRTALILRPAVIYGPGSKSNIGSMIRAIDQGYFFLVGRNDNVKSMVSITNVVAASRHLLSRASPGTAVYNLVDRQSYTVHQIAHMIVQRLGKRHARTVPEPLARVMAVAGDIVNRFTGIHPPFTTLRLKALTETTHFSCRKLVETNFMHPQTTEEGIGEMVEWYLRSGTSAAPG